MLIDLTPPQILILLESLARDVDRQRQAGLSDAILLDEIAVKCRAALMDKLSSENKAVVSQVDRYVKGQMQKIRNMSQRENHASAQVHDPFEYGGEKVSTGP